MAEDNKRTNKKATSLRSASTYSESTGRSANKSRSLREETYKPADPNKPGPQTIYLNSDYITYRNKPEAAEEETITNETADPATAKEDKEPFWTPLLNKAKELKDKFMKTAGEDSSETTGSSYKRRQVQQAGQRHARALRNGKELRRSDAGADLPGGPADADPAAERGIQGQRLRHL